MSNTKALPTGHSGRGIRPHAPMTWADYLRYLIALVVVVSLFLLGTAAIYPPTFAGWTVGDWAQVGSFTLGALVLASALGHALPTSRRGQINLKSSSVLTGLSLVLLLYLATLVGSGDASDPIGMLAFGMALFTPLILGAHLLRVFVPPLRPHIDGQPVQYFGKNAIRSSIFLSR